MTTISDASELISENTDELLAIVVTCATMSGYFIGLDVPTEPMMLILGYLFRKRVA